MVQCRARIGIAGIMNNFSLEFTYQLLVLTVSYSTQLIKKKVGV